MNEDKVIEQIARPIIEQLKKLDNSEIQKNGIRFQRFILCVMMEWKAL